MLIGMLLGQLRLNGAHGGSIATGILGGEVRTAVRKSTTVAAG